MRRRLRRAAGLLLALAGALALTPWTRGREVAGPDGRAGDDALATATKTAAGASPGGAAVAPALEAAPARPRDPPAEDRSAPIASGARLRGRVTVRGVEGALPPGTHVDVCALTSAREALLRRASPDADGRYEVEFDPSDVPDLRAFVVHAVVPGWAWAREVVRLGPSEDRVADLTLGRPGHSEVLRGRVLDPADHPVANLRLLLLTNLSPNPDTPLPDLDAEAYEVDRADGVVCALTTDGDGRFEVRGLADEALRTESLDGAWCVSEVSRRPARGGERTLRALPGFVLEGRLTDAATGEVLDGVERAMYVRVAERLDLTRRRRDGTGRFRWSQPLPAGAEAGFEVVLRASARGFRPAERVVRFGPALWNRTVELALERRRPEDVGRLRVLHEVRGVSGRPVRLTFLRCEPDGSLRDLEDDVVDDGADGFATLELPAGPAHLRILPRESVGTPALVVWQGTTEVEGARSTDFAVPFPPTGSLRVRTAGTEEPGTFRLVDPKDGARALTVCLAGDGTLLPVVPAGRWEAFFEERGRACAVRVDVVEGTVSEVLVPR